MFSSGQTVSWKHGMVGAGRPEPPNSFNEVIRMKNAYVDYRVSRDALEDAVIVLLDSIEFTFSVLNIKWTAKTTRVWRVLITCQAPTERAIADAAVLGRDISFSERPFYAWIREDHLEPNKNCLPSEKRLINHLRAKHRQKMAAASLHRKG